MAWTCLASINEGTKLDPTKRNYMMGLGFGELLVVLLIVILFFGGKKLPQLGASLGESIKNFKKGLKNDDSDKSP
jgi:sec-independent protein translocase protein TatA